MVLRRLRNWTHYCLILLAVLAPAQERSFTSVGIRPETSGSPPSPLKFYESRSNGTNYFYLKAPASLAANIGWEVPSADGSSGQCLGWSSANTLAWVACGGGGGGGITNLGGQTGATQSFADVDDTNVTLSWNSSSNTHTLTVGWTGTLAKARMAATTVHTDQANAYSTGNQNFSSATSLIIPVSAGCAPSTTGTICVDSTSNTFEVAINSTNKTVALTDGNIATATALASDPSGCSGGQFVTDIAANGTLTCATPTGSGNVSVSGSTTTNYVPYWTGTGGALSAGGYEVSNSGTANALARYTSGGEINTTGGLQVNGTAVISSARVVNGTQVAGQRVSNGSVFTSRVYADNSSNFHTCFYASSGSELHCIDYLGRFPADKLVGTIPVTNFNNGTNASSSTYLRGDGTWVTPTVSGGITGPGSSTNGYYPQWNGPTGTILQGGKVGASTTATASSVVERDSYGASVSYDKGGQVSNVKAYNAQGDDTTDDRSAIQAAIDGQPAAGGVVYFPPGSYVISSAHPSYSGCGIVIGNGSSAGYSSVNNIILQGAGAGTGDDISGDSNAQRGATRIRSGSASVTKLICIRGPIVNVWLKNMQIDANDVTATAVDWVHATQSGIDSVNIKRHTTYAIDGSAVTRNGTSNWAFYNCYNKFSNLVISEPQTTTTHGVRMSGSYDSDTIINGVTTPTYHTSCSNVWESFNISFGSGASAIGLQLSYADNNKFINGSINSFGASGAGSGKPVNFTQQSDGSSGTGFPYGNKFVAVDSNHGTMYYGTSGTNGNSAFMHTAQEGNLTPSVANMYSVSDNGTMVINSGYMTTKSIDAKDGGGTTIWHITRDSGTGRVSGGSGNGVNFYSFDEIFLEAPGGTRPSTDQNFSSLGTAANGIMRYCADCQVTSVGSDNICASGGNGALAVRLNGVWRCFAQQN